jgi:adhesin/invasin
MKFGRHRNLAVLTAAALTLGMVAANADAAPKHRSADTLTLSMAPLLDDKLAGNTELRAGSLETIRVGGLTPGNAVSLWEPDDSSSVIQPLDSSFGNWTASTANQYEPNPEGLPHLTEDATYANDDGFAYFAVRLGTAGTHTYDAAEYAPNDLGQALAVGERSLTVAAGSGLAANTTITASVKRISPEGANTTVVVRALDGDRKPVAGKVVTLQATQSSPSPSAEQAFGTGFFGASTAKPQIRAVAPLDPGHPEATTTDAHGVAVFSVSGAGKNPEGADIIGVAYLTPVFVDIGQAAHETAQHSTAVIFDEYGPEQEQKSSYMQAVNASSTTTGPTEVTVPADGTTGTLVYAHLRCKCVATGGAAPYLSPLNNFSGDIVSSSKAGMPAVTGQTPFVINGSLVFIGNGTGDQALTTNITGAVVSLRASGSSHASITPVAQVDPAHPTSQDPLGTGEAWTDSTGTAAFLVTDTVAEDLTLQTYDVTNNVLIHGGDDPDSVTLHFLPVSPDAANTTVTAAPASVLADGTSTTTITVTVRGVTNHPVSGRTVVLSADPDAATLDSSSVVTDINGVAKFTASSSHAGTINFNAKDPEGDLLGSVPVLFNAAPPSAANSTISASPSRVTAGDTTGSTITVHLADNAGNPDADLPVTLDQNGAHSTITPVGTLDPTDNTLHTDSNGNASFTVTDDIAEDVLYTAHINDFLISAIDPVQFVPGRLSTTYSTVETDVATVPANGRSKATVTVTLRDAQQNPLGGTNVKLTAAGSGAKITPADVVTTKSDGTATFVVSDATAEEISLIATDTTDNLTVNSTTVTFTGDPAASNSEVTISDASAPVGSLVRVLATVRDAQGHAISGEHLNISTFGGTVYQAGESSGNGTNDAGNAGFVIGSTSSGPVQVTVLDGLLPLGTATVTFFGAPNAGSTTISAAQQTVPDDGTEDTITVTVKDADGIPVAGQSVTLTADSTHTTITPASATTDSDGVASFTVSDHTVETVMYTGHVAGIDTAPLSVTFIAAVTEAAQSSVTAELKDPLYANGTDTDTVTVTLRDGHGVAIPRHSVRLDCGAGTTVLAPNPTPSGNDGVASFAVSATVAGPHTCSATDETNSVPIGNTADVIFTVEPTEANQSDLTTSARVVPTDGSVATVTVALKDATGQPIAGHHVTLSANGGHSLIDPASGVTGAAGNVTFQVSDATPESVTYSATDTDASPAATLDKTLTVTFSDERATSTALSAPDAVPADGHSAAAIVVMLKANGLPVVGHRVLLQPQNGTSHIAIQTNPTGQDGKATFLVSDDTPEVITYSVVDDSIGLTLAATPQVAFTSANRSAPVVTSMTPTSGPAHTVVTISGTGLAGAVVDFGTVPAETITVNALGTRITATAPGGSGPVAVKVITPGGTTTAGTFTYTVATAAKKVHAAKHPTRPAHRPGKAIRRGAGR